MAYEVIIDDKNVQKMLRRMINRSDQVDQKSRAYVGLLSAIVLQDVASHFEKESGPNGRWRAWSDKYRLKMERIGKGGNKILQDKGILRQGWVPTNVRTAGESVLWFNNVPYASRHDLGSNGMPKRQFAWLSAFALSKISKQTAQFIAEEFPNA